MGGYGGASGCVKGKCYYDTGGKKVTDKSAIAVAEYYIKNGKYVAFLQRKHTPRADLSVEGHHVEVKGISTVNHDSVEGHIKKAFIQIHGDDYRYPPETHREGKVILYSQHDEDEDLVHAAMLKGYRQAESKGYVTGKVELWIKGKIIELK